MALLHYQFEAIHPFADGNGRTGRILLEDEGFLNSKKVGKEKIYINTPLMKILENSSLDQ